ncbi:hypothetical protein GY21_07005 [Cryobacterium roopkundense]|uniref:Nuclease SbcCD subunit C n=1 Tax=Cryobacterium roopkundense TaxID=1001240 RepID=A0A099JIX5_9MICO|nr:SMC family ATPase [Cryobacterium roopkundense]KGJ78359.1 hypothetical protein GY21_07005 [Cryobacterium roopkundense]MBB5640009.1 exonuclease SbcC [Cryobacterium roopkundense]
MKITRLRLAGFGPFKNEQVVDFERFDDDGIFLITGKTGAGKSSILDAICFALYGHVPRFIGAEQQLRSDHCAPEDPSFVELEFRVHEQDYRVYRSPEYERSKKTGSGVTTAAPTAFLHIRDGEGGWRGIAAKPQAVGLQLSAILPLKEGQFLQVILLAQNRFQDFLLAKTEDRRTVLRTLFGTMRFEQLESALDERRKNLGDRLAGVQRIVAEHAAAAAQQLRLAEPPDEPGLAWFVAARDDLNRDRDSAAERATGAAQAFDGAADSRRAAEETERRQARRALAANNLDALEDQRSHMEAQRGALRLAGRAARVWPHVRSHRAAAAEWQQAVDAETSARAAWYAEGHASHDPLAPAMDALIGRLGALVGVLSDEEALPELDRELSGLSEELSRCAGDLRSAQERVDALPQQIDYVTTQLAAATVAAAGHDDAEKALNRALDSLAAAHDSARCEAELAVAGAMLSERSRRTATAAVEYDELVTRRFAGHASELATQLVDGEACAVCGSLIHPAPAAAEGELVGAVDLEQAREAMAKAQTHLTESEEIVRGISHRLAQAQAVAGASGIDELTLHASAARTKLAAAAAAAALLTDLAEELSALRSDFDGAQARVVALRDARDIAAGTQRERAGRRVGLLERVKAHRGTYDTVTEHVSELQRELDCARTLENALTLSRQRGDAEDAALVALTAQLAEESFDDESAAVSARLDSSAVDALETDVRGYDADMAAARGALADPDLRDLPLKPVDCGPSLTAFTAARAALDDSLALQGSLAERAGQLSALVLEVTRHITATEGLLAEHAQVRQLADVVQGREPNTKRMRLETYVLAAQLEEIVVAANVRLRTMTSGRYTLEHDDSRVKGGARSGLGLAIRDEFTGQARATHSLSGGETFLASLALALGLAEAVAAQAGGITLDTLFVDEGFGSLDSETLETAMGTLDKLRAGGRTIGLISHVESMKEQIPARLSIDVTDAGHSEVR